MIISIDVITGEQIELPNAPAGIEPIKSYQELRISAYPPISDYLDGIVKGDLVQQQTYIDACLAVKAKYPKV